MVGIITTVGITTVGIMAGTMADGTIDGFDGKNPMQIG